ncbi:MAG: glutamate synthase [Oscillospiraceae bacterium]|nr:glutamate synthase [Oscillospiraceae bacterium]
MIISAAGVGFKELNQQIRQGKGDVIVENCCGQRFIGSGINGKRLTITGTPGNALGAYLDGGVIDLNGNAQDAVGDTMNDGKIIIRGNAGDALGYGMRGGSIFVKGDSGYRTGIHMKEYKDKKPAVIIGGRAGSFLGEYLAGGLIVVLGLGCEGHEPVGNFTGTGMHGGKIFIRTDKELTNLPEQVTEEIASKDDLSEIEPYTSEFSGYFGIDPAEIMQSRFYLLKPNTKNPYKQLYTTN